MSKIVIIGAGPAGFWAAQTLSKEHHVPILEKRGLVGGSGLHGDGKLRALYGPKIKFYAMRVATAKS